METMRRASARFFSPRRERRALRALSPEALLVLGFAAVILVGSLLLMLPWSRTGDDANYLTALFMATSAVCVTGLIVVDFPNYYTPFGQAIILVLIQIGGLGVMTGAALIFRAVGRRLSLRSQAALQDSLVQMEVASDFRRIFRLILTLTFSIEAIGAVLLFVGFSLRGGAADAVFPAIFQAVSAFCNAGFSTFSDSLIGFQGEPLIVWTVMALILSGGIGGIVLIELLDRVRGRGTANGVRSQKLSLHARTVLWASAILVVAGTAGFNTVGIGELPPASLLIIVLLMFIGGSPGSTAGGVKTTTAALWVGELWSSVRRRDEVVLFDRAVKPAIVRRSMLLINLAVAWNFVGVILLMWFEGTEEFGFMELFFEQISAFGTVGLSTGPTSTLSAVSQIWI
ncbi:MAG TPA: potassium transporter TrkG, partial [Thermoleophilia bacterium]|nr:potassium transporter TrkG [Thermoleophilia bacterium]